MTGLSPPKGEQPIQNLAVLMESPRILTEPPWSNFAESASEISVNPKCLTTFTIQYHFFF